jgi:hypothetical protein
MRMTRKPLSSYLHPHGRVVVFAVSISLHEMHVVEDP